MAFDEDFGKTGLARRLFRLRFRKLKLNQQRFAERYGISHAMVRDVEQGRSKPSLAARTLIDCIALEPKLVERAAERVRESGGYAIP